MHELNTAFKQKSNAAFNNTLFSEPRIAGMHEQMKRLYKAAHAIRGVSGQSALARELNASPQTVKNWESRGISKQGMLDAQRVFSCSASWLETGDGQMVVEDVDALLDRRRHYVKLRSELMLSYGISNPVELNPVPRDLQAVQEKIEFIGRQIEAIRNQLGPSEPGLSSPGDNRLPIRRVLFKLSAGISGYEIEYENGESEPIYMGRRWFEQHHYRPDKLLAVKITGRSMEPSLYDGDLVVINTEDTTLRDGEVFAANFDGELVIKRLKRDAGQWYLASDNSDKARFGDKVCDEGCGLIGRVVYKQSEHI